MNAQIHEVTHHDETRMGFWHSPTWSHPENGVSLQGLQELAFVTNPQSARTCSPGTSRKPAAGKAAAESARSPDEHSSLPGKQLAEKSGPP